MSKYKSREAPVPGSSVSETHHGDWADRVRYERHIRERWMNEYGRYYYQNPSACCATEDLRHPLDTQQPPMSQIDNYLGTGSVPRSQPVAYLRACMAKKGQYDGSVLNDYKMGTRALKCTKCNICYVCSKNEASVDKNDCAKHSAGPSIPSDTCVHVDRSSQVQNICLPLEYSSLRWPLHLRSVALSTDISATPKIFCGSSSDCDRTLKQNNRSSLREVQKINGPVDSLALQYFPWPLPPRSTALHTDTSGTPVCCGSSCDCDRILKRNDRPSLREVQKISGPQDSSALQCLPWPLPPRSRALHTDILGTPVCCGSSSGERGHLANYLRKHSTSAALVPEKNYNVTILPGSRRMPRDSGLNYPAVVPHGYLQPFGKPSKSAN